MCSALAPLRLPEVGAWNEPLAAEAGGTVMGIDWRIELDYAWQQVGYDRGVQGNLDPAVLHTTPDVVRRRTEDILARVAGRPGHIMNLGHGILPETPVENVLEFIATVNKNKKRVNS